MSSTSGDRLYLHVPPVPPGHDHLFVQELPEMPVDRAPVRLQTLRNLCVADARFILDYLEDLLFWMAHDIPVHPFLLGSHPGIREQVREFILFFPDNLSFEKKYGQVIFRGPPVNPGIF